jgi:eukaryotic-like serine/threonine-protein kinase
MNASAFSQPASAPRRTFGRFELRRLLGKSRASMLWLAFDSQHRVEVMLSLPRVQPETAAELLDWEREVRRAARLNHPNLAPVSEVGIQDQWPYLVVERGQRRTVDEWIVAHSNPTSAEAVGWLCEVLQGLAFAHEAGTAHLDLQLHHVLIDDRGQVSLMAFGVAGSASNVAQKSSARSIERSMAMDPGELRVRRLAASRDVLATGVLLHHLLTAQPALEEADAAVVLSRMAPTGRELVRLPWSTPLPIPEALRAIANRCTSNQERLRYQSARTLQGALAGWLEALKQDGGGPIGTLLDRLRTVGHLPALPGLAARVSKVTSLERQRTDQIADQVLDDIALTLELLRALNSAQVQGTQIQGNGPVLTLRRAISLIGVNGVRLAANTLREWPGPLNEDKASKLKLLFDRVRLAGHTAQALRPKGYDAQVVYLVTILQNLGRLMVRYHFADEAAQIDQLMSPVTSKVENAGGTQPGLIEQAAAFAVLGVDIESIGAAVARQWGLGDEITHMARRQSPDAPVRRADSDDEVLRLTASAANDAVDAMARPAHERAAAIEQIAQRYGRVLGIGTRDITSALQGARDTMSESTLPAQRPHEPA